MVDKTLNRNIRITMTQKIASLKPIKFCYRYQSYRVLTNPIKDLVITFSSQLNILRLDNAWVLVIIKKWKNNESYAHVFEMLNLTHNLQDKRQAILFSILKYGQGPLRLKYKNKKSNYNYTIRNKTSWSNVWLKISRNALQLYFIHKCRIRYIF